MENRCLKCGKTKETDEFGYCEKCSNKLFKKEKHTTAEQYKIAKFRKYMIFLIALVTIISVSYFYRSEIQKTISIILRDKDYTSIETLSEKKSNKESLFNSIENTKLTKENYEELSNKYAEKNKDNDNLYYYSYAVLYYTMKDGLNNLSKTSKNEEIIYKNIYGKTINQLIKEGKELMKQNNITIEKYKENLKNTSK